MNNFAGTIIYKYESIRYWQGTVDVSLKHMSFHVPLIDRRRAHNARLDHLPIDGDGSIHHVWRGLKQRCEEFVIAI
jgi:hypothetical protein